MKKKLFYVGIFVTMILGFTACGEKKEKQNEKVSKDIVKEKIISYTETYDKEVKENNEIHISIVAPDFAVIGSLCKDNEELDEEQLCQLLEDNKDSTKVYEFTVEAENKIEEKFLDMVSYDLLIGAMRNVSMEDNEVRE